MGKKTDQDVLMFALKALVALAVLFGTAGIVVWVAGYPRLGRTLLVVVVVESIAGIAPVAVALARRRRD